MNTDDAGQKPSRIGGAISEQTKQGLLTRLSSSPLTIAFVTGVCAIIAGAFTGYFTTATPPPASVAPPANTEQIAKLTARIEELEAENKRLLAQVKQSPPTEVNPQDATYFESFVIPNNQFMGIANHRYTVTVSSINAGVGEISLKDVRDRDGFTDRKFVTKGSSLRLQSTGLECTLKVLDILNAAINMTTECTEKG